MLMYSPGREMISQTIHRPVWVSRHVVPSSNCSSCPVGEHALFPSVPNGARHKRPGQEKDRGLCTMGLGRLGLVMGWVVISQLLREVGFVLFGITPKRTKKG